MTILTTNFTWIIPTWCAGPRCEIASLAALEARLPGPAILRDRSRQCLRAMIINHQC